jgi:hypothetical protein
MDDDEPVTEEWLQSVGFASHGESNGDLFSEYSEPMTIPGDDTYRRRIIYKKQLKFLVIDEDAEFNRYDEVNRIALPMPRSRGEVSILCSTLGIPLGVR